MQPSLTIREKALLHLSQFMRHLDGPDAPLEISQDGVAAALGITRAHAAIEIKKLKESGEIEEHLRHIRKGKNKRKVYFLTPAGEAHLDKIREVMDANNMDPRVYMDISRFKGTEILERLDEDYRPIVKLACVLRRPAPKSLLDPPRGRIKSPLFLNDNLVDVPAQVKREVRSAMSPEELRERHSKAADQWLEEKEFKGHIRERVYHMIRAGRSCEVAMMSYSRLRKEVFDSGDKEVLEDIVEVKVPRASQGLQAKIVLMQSEALRSLGDIDAALAKADELLGMPGPKERGMGEIARAHALRDAGDLAGSLDSLRRARDLNGSSAELECDIAETLLDLGRTSEARGMEAALSLYKDDEILWRVLYVLGCIHLRSGDANRAVHYLQKSRGVSNGPETRDLCLMLAEAYGKTGMKQKAEEFAAMAKSVRVPRDQS